MEREPFGTRARRRIWRDTLDFIKGRAVPLGIAVTVILVGVFIHHVWLHQQTAKELTLIGVISIAGSYAIWFLGALIANTLRVPWLLDAESGQQINTLEARALKAEAKVDNSEQAEKENKRLQDIFGHLMQAGINFSSQLAQCQTPAHFASWDRHYQDWIKSVQVAIRDMGFLTDAAEFIRAGEYAEPVKGVMNTGNEQEQRCRVLEKYQEKLAEFVERRLP